MNNKIVYNNNGAVGIVSIAAGYLFEDCLNTLPKDCKYAIFSEEEISNTKHFDNFFNAIILDVDGESSKIDFDIVKAREITKERLRKERIPYFEKSDIAIRDAMIENSFEKLKEAVDERNRLRDITLLVEQCSTLDDLISLHL
jgi:hypothetical protein